MRVDVCGNTLVYTTTYDAPLCQRRAPDVATDASPAVLSGQLGSCAIEMNPTKGLKETRR
jgi:hypothetical protein